VSFELREFQFLISKNGVFSDGDWVESKDQDPNGEVRLIQLADIGIGEFIDKSNRYMTLQKAKELRCTFLEPGDILVARMPDPIGRACIFPGSNMPCVTVVDVCIIRPAADDVDPKWLMHSINSKKFNNKILKFVTGTTRQRISRGNLAKLEIPLPPLAEQKRIAAILDKADSLRRKRQQAIQLADQFLRAVFLDMFGDPVTNPKGWEVKTVNECLANGSILEVQDGNHGNDHPKVSDFSDNGYPFITANVVRNGKILFDKCYYLDERWLKKLRIGFAKPGDVLLTHKGSLGFTAVLDNTFDTYIFSPQTTYYRLNHEIVEPEFLKGYFDSQFFQRLFQRAGIQSTRAYLGITRQRELPIMIPPIDLQRKYLSLVNKSNRMIDKVYESNCIKSKLVNSLSQKAFAAEL
jgi:type I restriction enzyme S subunit